jgi:imidazolonepropionase-like amidohydrolase
VLAAPDSGIFKGQSALVNVVLPPDDPQISTIADYRSGLAVVRAPVATHIDMAGRGAGDGYPQALLGTIAFTRQGLLDAQWQREAQRVYEAGGARGPRPLVEPALDALAPALTGEMPAVLDADEAREIDRALAIAGEFGLDPIIVGGSGAAARTEELKAANARVILSLNFGAGQGGRGGRGGRGGGGPSLRQLRAQADAPKVATALAEAGIPFAFTSAGLAPAEFVQNAGRTVNDGGLAAEAALHALTLGAAEMAGAADRTGSVEVGKIGNLVVTSGDLLSGGEVRHVFIDGLPVTLAPPAPPAGGRGRGGR